MIRSHIRSIFKTLPFKKALVFWKKIEAKEPGLQWMDTTKFLNWKTMRDKEETFTVDQNAPSLFSYVMLLFGRSEERHFLQTLE